jgi:hypothetical protein
MEKNSGRGGGGEGWWEGGGKEFTTIFLFCI